MVVAAPNGDFVWKKMIKKSIISTRVVKPAAKDQFIREIQQINWSPLYKSNTCEDKFALFMGKMTSLLDQHFPLVDKAIYSNDKPWITSKFKRLIAKRQSAKACNDVNTYNQLRNWINRMSQSLRTRLYATSNSKISGGTSKERWRSIKQLLGLNTKDSSLDTLTTSLCNGNTETLANRINQTFQEVSDDMTPTVSHTICTNHSPRCLHH